MDEFKDFMQECRVEFKENATFRGQVGEFMKNSNEHVKAVSDKANRIDAKVNDQAKTVYGTAGIISALGALGSFFIHKLGGGH